MPEDMPDRMPDDMPDRMPEDMSDRMPEDLPVTKCINVMVGITRSKVIVFLICLFSGLFFLFALVFFFLFLFLCETLHSLCCWTKKYRLPSAKTTLFGSNRKRHHLLLFVFRFVLPQHFLPNHRL